MRSWPLVRKRKRRALHRFGFGPRGNAITDIVGDPRGAVLDDLERRSAGRIANTDLPTSAQAARQAFNFRAERRAHEIAAKKEAERGKMATPSQKPDAAQTNGQTPGANPGGGTACSKSSSPRRGRI